MILAYSDIKFSGEFAAFNVSLKPKSGKLDYVFITLQSWLRTKDIICYEVHEICTQSVEVRIQINVSQIAWNDGTQISFRNKEA